MAFVLQFAPQDFVSIPKHGTIQYHPSLLPKYRGPSSINWPIIARREEDRPDHLPADRRPRRGRGDPAEGDADRRRTTRSARCTSTACSRWGCRRCWKRPIWSFPTSTRRWCRTSRRPPTRAGSARPRRRSTGPNHVDFDPQPDPRLQPGAGRLDHPERDQAADLRRPQGAGAHLRRRQGQDRRGSRGGRGPARQVTAQGGRIDAGKAKLGDGKKVTAADLISSGQIKPGTLLGT